MRRLAVLVALAFTLGLLTLELQITAQCVDYPKDPAGCQPTVFRTPFGQLTTALQPAFCAREFQSAPKANAG